METITVDQGCVWLFGCRSKSVGAGVPIGSKRFVALYGCYAFTFAFAVSFLAASYDPCSSLCLFIMNIIRKALNSLRLNFKNEKVTE